MQIRCSKQSVTEFFIENGKVYTLLLFGYPLKHFSYEKRQHRIGNSCLCELAHAQIRNWIFFQSEFIDGELHQISEFLVHCLRIKDLNACKHDFGSQFSSVFGPIL